MVCERGGESRTQPVLEGKGVKHPTFMQLGLEDISQGTYQLQVLRTPNPLISCPFLVSEYQSYSAQWYKGALL